MSIFDLFSRETKGKSQKRKFGDLGEEIFVKHLVKHNYRILDRNFLKKYGEIDIVAEKGNVLHFFEVKTVNGAEGEGVFSPEDNVHREKRKRLARTIESYLAEKKIPETVLWQVDVAAIFLDLASKKHTIRVTEDIDISH